MRRSGSSRRRFGSGRCRPLWCALSLGFVPSALYAFVAYAQPLSTGQIVGVSLAALAVVFGAMQQKSNSASHPEHPLLYSVVLVGLFVANSFINLAMADLKAHPGHGANLLDAHGNRFMAVMYLSIGVCAWIDLGPIRRTAIVLRVWPPTRGRRSWP